MPIQRFDKVDRSSFIHYFMTYYQSPGIGIPARYHAYCRYYVVTELKTCYKITIGEITKRFTSKYVAANYVFNKLFNPKFINIEIEQTG